MARNKSSRRVLDLQQPQPQPEPEDSEDFPDSEEEGGNGPPPGNDPAPEGDPEPDPEDEPNDADNLGFEPVLPIQQQSYHNMLLACGLDEVSVHFLKIQMGQTAHQFMMIPLSGMGHMFSGILRGRPPRSVSLPYCAQLAVKAARAWLGCLEACGTPINCDGWFEGMKRKWTSRIQELDDAKLILEQEKPPMPEKFTDLSSWPHFKDSVLAYLAKHRSIATGTPLTYVVREHDIVTAEIRDKDHGSIDDDLVNNIDLGWHDFAADNKRVYDILMPLFYDGPAWPFATKYKAKQDGRSMWLVVKLQAEGTSSVMTRKSIAYATLKNAKYNGKSRYTLDQHIGAHQKAHNELLELGEPVAETKKVTDFLASLQDSNLAELSKFFSMFPDKMDNFEFIQQTVKTYLTNNKPYVQEHRDQRSIKGISTNKGKWNGKPNARGKKPDGKGRNSDNQGCNHYDKEQWWALSEEQRASIIAARKKKEPKRSVGAVSTSPIDKANEPAAKKVRVVGSIATSAERPNKSQFGREAHEGK